MAKIRPSRTVNPRIETTCPFTVTTTPASPFTRTGRSCARGNANVTARLATFSAPRTTADAATRLVPPSDRRTTSGSSTLINAAKSPPRAAAKNTSTTSRWRGASVSGGGSAPCTHVGALARELPGRFGRALDHGCDLVERHREHVVQHERETLRWVECLEHDQQRQAHGVGEHDRVARVDRVNRLPGHDRIGHPRLERLLAPRAPGAQHVEATRGR